MEERNDVLVSQLVFGDAHELAGGGGGFEAGDGGEFVVVDLGGGCMLGSCCMAKMFVEEGTEGEIAYLWLGFEALPLLFRVSWLMQSGR